MDLGPGPLPTFGVNVVGPRASDQLVLKPIAGDLGTSGGLELNVATGQRSGPTVQMAVSTSSLGPRILGLSNVGEVSMDELLQPFDPTFRLSKLSLAYQGLKGSMSIFDEAFEVCVLLLDLRSILFLVTGFVMFSFFCCSHIPMTTQVSLALLNMRRN